MKKQTKKLIIIFMSCIVFQIFKYSTVFAAENTLSKIDSLKTASNVTTEEKGDTKNSNDISSLPKYITADIHTESSLANVSVNKVWKVKFSDELDVNTVKNNVRVIDRDTNQETDINIDLQENNKTLIIYSSYLPNRTYTLIINGNIKSKNNKYLKNTISKDFITGKTLDGITGDINRNPIVSSVDDINITIKQNEKFNMPYRVNANMSNGAMAKMKVQWDKYPEDTSIPGSYTFYGNIQGYQKKICLNLIINPTKNSNDTNINNNNENSSNSNDSKDVNDSNNENSNKQDYRDTDDLNAHSALQKNLYNYLMSDDNRQAVMKRAIELHDGDPSNTCVYFTSEALRRAGLKDLEESVCNTLTLTAELKQRGWQVCKDLSQLRSGDICFTISYGAGPTHAYTFMKWVDPNNYHYAYICDNQGKQYGNAYHKRNIDIATKEKDPIQYFMYKP